MIEASEILCSESPSGDRLMTMLCAYPQFVHNEHLRHRAFSFSVSSNRAIPLTKQIAEVRDDATRAGPVWWGAEQRGMSAGDELSDEPPTVRPDDGTLLGYGWSAKGAAQDTWKDAALRAAQFAEELSQIGLHKSIASRVLSPFLHHRVLVTGTTAGWMNFFGLRLDRAAQAEIRALAEAQWRVWGEARPQKLEPGQWHLPFIDNETIERIAQSWIDEQDWPTGIGKDQAKCDIVSFIKSDEATNTAIRISVARCARLSYLSFETGRRSTIEEDLALYDRLVGSSPIHASPAEHIATPDKWNDDLGTGKMRFGWEHPGLGGNLGSGWIQFRKTLPKEAIAPLPEGYR